jgi:hypothetical protein
MKRSEAAMYSPFSVAPSASQRSIVRWISSGIPASSPRAADSNACVLGAVLASARLATPAGAPAMYSIARNPPHE